MSVQGQGRAMMPATSHAVVAAPRAVAHAAPPVVSRATPTARVVVRTGIPRARIAASSPGRVTRKAGGTHRSAGATAFTSDFVPVPGLGFDMVHLAATRGPEAVGAGRHREQLPILFPFIDGGFFLPRSPVVVEEAAAPEAAEENTETEVAERPRRARVTQPAPAPPQVEEASAAPRQTEEFVFVRRDGTVFFAVAYAWENGVLRYVTSEGLRRSIARETLDLNATQQFNEQRGLNFRSPA
ncbi:MAG: hypothetical protein WAQ77_02525 [Candidatus Acidiferrum sp.]